MAAVNRISISVAKLRELFAYDPESGEVRSLLGLSPHEDDDGYLVFSVSGTGKKARSHRIAWALHYDEWPKGQIDHINGNAKDNRLENLRDVSVVVNQQNQRRPRRDNKTGYLGVAPKRRSSGVLVFAAYIRYGGKQHWLGDYKSPEEAHKAYLAEKRVRHAGNTL